MAKGDFAIHLTADSHIRFKGLLNAFKNAIRFPQILFLIFDVILFAFIVLAIFAAHVQTNSLSGFYLFYFSGVVILLFVFLLIKLFTTVRNLVVNQDILILAYTTIFSMVLSINSVIFKKGIIILFKEPVEVLSIFFQIASALLVYLLITTKFTTKSINKVIRFFEIIIGLNLLVGLFFFGGWLEDYIMFLALLIPYQIIRARNLWDWILLIMGYGYLLIMPVRFMDLPLAIVSIFVLISIIREIRNKPVQALIKSSIKDKKTLLRIELSLLQLICSLILLITLSYFLWVDRSWLNILNYYSTLVSGGWQGMLLGGGNYVIDLPYFYNFIRVYGGGLLAVFLVCLSLLYRLYVGKNKAKSGVKFNQAWVFGLTVILYSVMGATAINYAIIYLLFLIVKVIIETNQQEKVEILMRENPFPNQKFGLLWKFLQVLAIIIIILIIIAVFNLLIWYVNV